MMSQPVDDQHRLELRALIEQSKEAQRSHRAHRLQQGREFAKTIRRSARETEKLAKVLRSCKPLPDHLSESDRQTVILRFVELTLSHLTASAFWAERQRNTFDDGHRERPTYAMNRLHNTLARLNED
jgi:hypothetical protein